MAAAVAGMSVTTIGLQLVVLSQQLAALCKHRCPDPPHPWTVDGLLGGTAAVIVGQSSWLGLGGSCLAMPCVCERVRVSE